MYMISRHDVGHNRTTEAAQVGVNRRYCCTLKLPGWLITHSVRGSVTATAVRRGRVGETS